MSKLIATREQQERKDKKKKAFAPVYFSSSFGHLSGASIGNALLHCVTLALPRLLPEKGFRAPHPSTRAGSTSHQIPWLCLA